MMYLIPVQLMLQGNFCKRLHHILTHGNHAANKNRGVLILKRFNLKSDTSKIYIVVTALIQKLRRPHP